MSPEESLEAFFLVENPKAALYAGGDEGVKNVLPFPMLKNSETLMGFDTSLETAFSSKGISPKSEFKTTFILRSVSVVTASS